MNVQEHVRLQDELRELRGRLLDKHVLTDDVTRREHNTALAAEISQLQQALGDAPPARCIIIRTWAADSCRRNRMRRAQPPYRMSLLTHRRKHSPRTRPSLHQYKRIPRVCP